MLMGRLKGAVSDVAETLRRAFSDPPCHRLDPSLDTFAVRGMETLGGHSQSPPFLFQGCLLSADLQLPVLAGPGALDFEARLHAEGAFAQWEAGAKVCEMEVFTARAGQRVAIPTLPRRAKVCAVPPEDFRTRARSGMDTVARPRVRGAEPGLAPPRVRQDLELALGLPMAIPGEDPQQLPKPLWMRYTLQIVKATGENIRNLEVLGLYRIPTKGVASLRHDPRTGRLVIQLNAAASGAPRAPFMLARRKDDRTIVSCFLEGG